MPVEELAEADSLALRIHQAEEKAWARGRQTHESASIEAILAEAGVDADHDRHLLALAAYRRFWEPHTHTDPQVRPLWEGLHDRGLKVGVLSNTIWTREYHREVFQRDGVLDLLDGDVYSSEIHVVKPHPEAFLAACAAVGVAPEAAVYVGDRLFEDVHGPQQVGMRAIWVPHSDIPVNQQVAVDVAPDALAHELLDILDIVDGWLGR
jgi:putative hydrolase of the HAD superfamily